MGSLLVAGRRRDGRNAKETSRLRWRGELHPELKSIVFHLKDGMTITKRGESITELSRREPKVTDDLIERSTSYSIDGKTFPFNTPEFTP
jgi:hypothetical protein